MQRVVVFFGGAVASLLFAHGKATGGGFVQAIMVLTAMTAIWPRVLGPWLVVAAIIVGAGFSLSALCTFDGFFDPAPAINRGWWSALACAVLGVAGGVGRLLGPRNLDPPSIPPAQARR